VNYWQDAAIIFRSSTFSFGAFIPEEELEVDEVDAVDELEPVLLADSTVPVISTLCPTCGVSFASLASSRYSFALLLMPDRLLVPVVPVVLVLLVALPLLLPLVTFVRMKLVSFAEDADDVVPVVEVVPVVPVGLDCARCTQPVTVILLSDVLREDDGSCARSPAVHAIDTNAAVKSLTFIVPPS